MAYLLTQISEAINSFFGPPLRAFFGPIETLLAMTTLGFAKFVALTFFVGTMVWVFVGLKKGYVNLEAPSKRVWHDLRFWVIVSMLPHIVVYLMF
jgi:hypothetical protein